MALNIVSQIGPCPSFSIKASVIRQTITNSHKSLKPTDIGIHIPYRWIRPVTPVHPNIRDDSGRCNLCLGTGRSHRCLHWPVPPLAGASIGRCLHRPVPPVPPSAGATGARFHRCLETTGASIPPVPRNHRCLNTTGASKSPVPRNHRCLEMPRNHRCLEITGASKSPVPRNHRCLETTGASKSPVPRHRLIQPMPRHQLTTGASKLPVPRNHRCLGTGWFNRHRCLGIAGITDASASPSAIIQSTSVYCIHWLLTSFIQNSSVIP